MLVRLLLSTIEIHTPKIRDILAPLSTFFHKKNDQSALAGKTAHSHIFYRLHTCLFKKNAARRNLRLAAFFLIQY